MKIEKNFRSAIGDLRSKILRNSRTSPHRPSPHRTSRIADCKSMLLALLIAAPASAAPTQEEVLRSISQSISEPTAVSPQFVAVLIAAVAAMLLLVWFNTRDKKERKPKVINHSRKLLRQMGRQIGLAKVEIKQLKILADIHERTTGQALEHPLTLLLCPSILTQALESNDVKIDRQVIAKLARRLTQANVD